MGTTKMSIKVETMRDGTQPTSVALYMKGGGYLIELDTEHFRSRQHAMPVTDEAAQATILPAPHPAYWRLFETIAGSSRP